MKTKHFFICAALALGVIGVFNIVLAIKVDSVPKLIMRRMRAVPQIDILFLGNSIMEAGIDAGAVEAAWPEPNAPAVFNAGLGSSSPVEHYLLAQQAYLHHPAIPCLVYGFYDLQLTKPEKFGWGDLVGNRAMGYSTEPATAASLYAPGSIVENLRFRLIGAVPMLREHSQLWKYVELFRRALQEVGMPKAKTNQFGRVADFDTSSSDLILFKEGCKKAVQDSTPFVLAVRELLRLAHEQNTRVIVVETPMNTAHRNQYYSTSEWRQYRTYLQQRLQAEGASYVVASDWVPDDADFSDRLHLNRAGAAAFSKQMAQHLAANPAPH